ncbi:MAG TPA: glutamyl-tRNA reductase [Verrucomicrobiae bacterium]|nr:glutamyl-tRNA reductase [Verrucomicrobiae bacterium]
MTFFVIGLSHKTASVGLREQFAVNASNLVARATRLRFREDLDEILLLSTCNRVEIYATSHHGTGRVSSLLQSLCDGSADLRPPTYIYEDLDAARHLFRVTAGLDSMVLGETEITGQVKKSYEMARASRLTGGTLNRVFQKAFRVAKEIRTRTFIGRGATSVGGVAVELAERIFPHDLSSQPVMIIGAGQMGEACVRHLAKKGARSILVSNRSFDRAVELAGEFGGQAVRFEDCLTAMARADIVVASTGCPDTLLNCEDVHEVMVKRRNRPLILIDISVPRNIDAEVQHFDNVYLYNIDDLKEIVCANVHNREQDLALCNRIIETGAVALLNKLNSRKEPGEEEELQFHSGCCATVVGG